MECGHPVVRSSTFNHSRVRLKTPILELEANNNVACSSLLDPATTNNRLTSRCVIGPALRQMSNEQSLANKVTSKVEVIMLGR